MGNKNSTFQSEVNFEKPRAALRCWSLRNKYDVYLGTRHRDTPFLVQFRECVHVDAPSLHHLPPAERHEDSNHEPHVPKQISNSQKVNRKKTSASSSSSASQKQMVQKKMVRVGVGVGVDTVEKGWGWG